MFDRYVRARKLALASSLLLAAGPAFAGQSQPVVVYAEPDQNMRTEKVSYADLDLATLKGERTLRLRVAGAVKNVCLFDHGHIGLQPSGYYNCAGEAMSGARPQMAQAVQRAREIALNGTSSIAATAITIKVSAR